jgi:hypothetical protein
VTPVSPPSGASFPRNVWDETQNSPLITSGPHHVVDDRSDEQPSVFRGESDARCGAECGDVALAQFFFGDEAVIGNNLDVVLEDWRDWSL